MELIEVASSNATKQSYCEDVRDTIYDIEECLKVVAYGNYANRVIQTYNALCDVYY